MELFIDSSAFFAWNDQESPEGKQIEKFLSQERPPLVTTNLVFAETISLLTKRVGKYKGLEMGEKIRTSKTIDLVYLSDAVQDEGWALFKKYKDKDFDFIDATSFVVCRQRGIKEVITLDRHFAQMGFKVHP